MVRLLQHRISEPEPCPYLPGRESTTETMLMTSVSAAQLERLLEQGFRRFGPLYFRPVCAQCSECVPVRVPVASFALSKNLRRVLARAQKVRVEVGLPRVDDQRLALYRRWHALREGDRGWKPDTLTEQSYQMQFAFPHPAAREYSYWLDGALVGIGIMDELPHSISAVYCFYEPAHAALSLGTFNVLTALANARAAEKQHVYLGYRVEDCPSLSYKGRFVPQERLEGRPETGEAPRWMPS